MIKLFLMFPLFLCMVSSNISFAKSKLIGKPAQLFELKNQDGNLVKLSDRKGKGFTVLFFYPKAGTPGCTTQACAFRDAIKTVTTDGTVVYGISVDTIEDQKKFHTEHKLSFDLLADDKGAVTAAFDVKMPVINRSKRQTFILDSDLIVREHLEDVDPALDPKNVATAISKLQSAKK
jgi:peroxiredoxin Q/BCP